MRTIAILAALLFITTPAFAWGPDGHAVVAGIAARELTPAARRQVDILIGAPASVSMAAVSSWADWQGRKHPETKPWHYVDIEISDAGYVARRDCPDGDCVVGAIAREEAILADTSQPRDARAEALMWLIHLVGDLHQPLHCADDYDRGGNSVPVSIGDYDTNLHRVWDHDEVLQLGIDPSAIAHRLDRRITAHQRRQWAQGAPEEWANESHAIAQRIYAQLPTPGSNGAVILTRADLHRHSPVAAQQLEKAGIRLASILSAILRERGTP